MGFIQKSAMEMKICLALVICATAAMATGHAFEAPQDLQSVENEVRKVAAEISTMHHASDDAALDAQATGDDHDAQLDDAKEAHRQADPVMQLEEADDASDSHIQELEGETAKVQSDDTRNDMAQEASAEGFEKAPAADTARAFELADGLKKSDLLPPGWVEKADQKSGKTYYENLEAGKTTWEAPRSLVSIALAAARGQRDSQTQIQMLKTKLEEMSSTRDLGESAGNGCGAMKKAQEAMQHAAVAKMKEVVSSLAKDLNLTGEQQKMLDVKMKKLQLPTFAPPVPAAKPAPAKKTIQKHQDLGEAASVSSAVSEKEEEDAKDKIAMANAETLAQKVAQESAMREAAQLHDNDAKLREEVETAANKKEIELQKEDDELEQASNSEDKMAAEIMGPKASAAEREEEKILTGEMPTNINSDTKEAELEELDFGAPAKVKALIAKVENDD